MKKLNNKGFTLVEILAVITMLSLIIIVVATKGFGAFDNTKVAITEENRKTIYEAANVLMTEVKNCEGNEDIFSNLFDKFLNEEQEENKTCEKLIGLATKKDDETGCLDIPLSYLIEKNYITSQGVKDILNSSEDFNIKGCLDPVTKEPEVIVPESIEDIKTTTQTSTTSKINTTTKSSTTELPEISLPEDNIPIIVLEDKTEIECKVEENKIESYNYDSFNSFKSTGYSGSGGYCDDDYIKYTSYDENMLKLKVGEQEIKTVQDDWIINKQWDYDKAELVIEYSINKSGPLSEIPLENIDKITSVTRTIKYINDNAPRLYYKTNNYGYIDLLEDRTFFTYYSDNTGDYTIDVKIEENVDNNKIFSQTDNLYYYDVYEGLKNKDIYISDISYNSGEWTSSGVEESVSFTLKNMFNVTQEYNVLLNPPRPYFEGDYWYAINDNKGFINTKNIMEEHFEYYSYGEPLSVSLSVYCYDSKKEYITKFDFSYNEWVSDFPNSVIKDNGECCAGIYICDVYGQCDADTFTFTFNSQHLEEELIESECDRECLYMQMASNENNGNISVEQAYKNNQEIANEITSRYDDDLSYDIDSEQWLLNGEYIDWSQY